MIIASEELLERQIQQIMMPRWLSSQCQRYLVDAVSIRKL